MERLTDKIEHDFFASRVWCTDDFLHVELTDGREIKVPLEFYPRLKQATQAEREHVELIGLGSGIHFRDIDEDLSVEGILLGIPARF